MNSMPTTSTQPTTPMVTASATLTRKLLGTDPLKADTDGDGKNDKTEVGANLSAPVDTDGDRKIDALESSIIDTDGDGTMDELDGDIADTDSDGG